MKAVLNFILTLTISVMVTLLIVLLTGLIFGSIACLLWNWLCPAIFGLPTITWIQAYGLSVLISFLLRPTSINYNYKK